ESLSTDGSPVEAATWFGEDEKGRPYAIGMAQNHTLTLCTAGWKFIEPKGGAKMIPWGPKIETGYSTTPQIFKHVNGEFNENQNMASSNTGVVENLSNQLEKIRNREYKEVTIMAKPGDTIDLTPYFGKHKGATVSGDFLNRDATDLRKVTIRSNVSDGTHTGVVAMHDGTIYLFTVVTNQGDN
ncbi:MAG: hypothetical protein IKY37_00055, partial [Bacteroidaceae bacterium]|nr:hypothetical protein [Bacteroidaceae bacterium]